MVLADEGLSRYLFISDFFPSKRRQGICRQIRSDIINI